MSRRSQSLAERRLELVDRSATQRAALVADAQPLLGKAAAADRIVGMVRRYPVVTTLAVGAVALIGPRRLFDFGTRALTLYMLLRR
ncbi:MAG TPA: YqjK family protein [Burkholderiales bacterium]|nr:YqjK family protein [Burkholderiales bacterium]